MGLKSSLLADAVDLYADELLRKFDPDPADVMMAMSQPSEYR
jgi:hypothetical protein